MFPPFFSKAFPPFLGWLLSFHSNHGDKDMIQTVLVMLLCPCHGDGHVTQDGHVIVKINMEPASLSSFLSAFRGFGMRLRGCWKPCSHTALRIKLPWRNIRWGVRGKKVWRKGSKEKRKVGRERGKRYCPCSQLHGCPICSADIWANKLPSLA